MAGREFPAIRPHCRLLDSARDAPDEGRDAERSHEALPLALRYRLRGCCPGRRSHHGARRDVAVIQRAVRSGRYRGDRTLKAREHPGLEGDHRFKRSSSKPFTGRRSPLVRGTRRWEVPQGLVGTPTTTRARDETRSELLHNILHKPQKPATDSPKHWQILRRGMTRWA
jgi:hypothetical protein